MIFITVGTQLPFDRLVRVVDEAALEIDEEIVCQTGGGRYEPVNFPFQAMVSPRRFAELGASCRVLVAHAGVGSILAAKRFGKPILVMPRQASLGEHRNEHQRATLAALDGHAGIYAFKNKEELLDLLGQELVAPALETNQSSRERLIRHLASLVG